jgi:hypothetical protein
MPIRPENPAPLSEPLGDFLDLNEQAALSLMADSFGVDVARSYQFWEAMVARITSGTLTEHKCPWDVELPYLDEPIRIEVKYAQETMCRFQTGTRAIFKFAAPKGMTTEKPVDVVVLVGIDGLDHVSTWVVPGAAIRQCASITMTSPRFRRGGASRSRGVDGFLCPPSQVLPEVLRSYRVHLHYDRDHHAETRAHTRAVALAEAGQLAIGDTS